MDDVQAVSTGIATALSSLGIHEYDYGPDAPTPPAAFTYPLAFPYHGTLEGGVAALWVVRLMVGSVAMQGGQRQLNALISPQGSGSAVAAIEANGGTLGGVVSGAMVREMRNYGVLTLPDKATRFLSAELVVAIL